MFTDVQSHPDPEPAQRGPKQRWLRIALWAVGAVFVVILTVAVGLSLLLRNERFHEYLLKTVEKNATDTLGASVHLQNFTLHLSDLRLDLYGLRIDGAAPYTDPPLLLVDHAQAGVRILSLMSRKWYVSNIQIDRPVVRIYVDANGVSNLPKVKSSGENNSQTSVFDLGVRRAVLDRGELYYNDRKSILSADLKDVDFHASFDALTSRYTGTLGYANGHLTSGTFQPIPHNLTATFDATPSTFRLVHSALTSGSSQVSLTATLTHYADPVVEAKYTAVVDGSELSRVLRNQSIPAGVLHASGKIRYAAIPHQPALIGVSLEGDLNSELIEVKSPSLRTRVRGLVGHYTLAGGDLTLHDLGAQLFGGSLLAQGTMKDLGGNPHSDFHVSARNLSLADMQRAAAPTALPRTIALSGDVSAEANAKWGEDIRNLLANADATVRGRFTGRNPNGSPAPVVPLDGAIHGSYVGSRQEVALTNSYLRTPATRLNLNGTVSDRSALHVQLEAKDLREFETISLLLRRPSPGHPVLAMGLSGAGSFEGTVRGSTRMPHLQGHLSTTDVHFNGTTTKVLRTDVDLSPSYAGLKNGSLELAPHGNLNFNASTGLKAWSYTQTSPIQVDLQATQLDVAQIQGLAGQNYPITGTASLAIKLHGTQLNPVGDGSLSLKNVVAYQEPIRTIDLKFAGTGDEVQSTFSVDLPAGRLEGEAAVQPRMRTYDATISSNGVHLDELQGLKTRNLNAKGVLAVQMRGRGSFENPDAHATLTIPQLVIQNQTIQSLSLKLDVANHVGEANLSTSAIGTGIKGHAHVELSGNYMTDAKIDTQTIPLQPLIATYAPDQAGYVTGQTEIHATLQGPLKDKSQIEAHVVVPVLTLGYTDKIQLAAAAPIRVDYKNTIVQVQRSAIRGTETDLQFEGIIPTSGTGPMSLMLLGTVDLRLAQLFDPDVRSSGQVKFNIDSKGPVTASTIGGEIDIVNANYATLDLPVGLQRANGVLTLTKDRINIQRFEGTIGGGKVTAQGGVTYRPGLIFDLGVSAQGVRALYPKGMRETVDANLRMTGTVTNALLSGNVSLAEISFTPAFDLNEFIGQLSGGVSAPPSPGFSQNLQLNIGLHSTNDIELVSRTVSIGGAANLQVRGTGAQPVILGRVNLTNGDVILNGERFVLNGGTIQFVNPSQTEPVVNVALNTTIQQYNIFLRFQGPVAQLHTEYSSDPALPSADIINLLAFGKTTEASAANPSTPPNQAAASLVASQVSSQVTSRISKVAGISQLSINPVLQGGSSQGPPGANITVQQRVTGNLFVTFSTNVASTQSQTVQGQYQVSPRVAVSATRNQNGGVAVDTLIKKTW